MSTVERYSRGAITLHWLIALLLAGELALGFVMPRDASGFALFQLHKSIGITILLLTLLRIYWRMAHPRPAKLEGGFNGFLASAVHAGFYGFMVLAPLSGWALVSTAEINVPTLLFGTIPLPHLPLPDALGETFEEAHELLAFFGLGLFVLHVAGALRHHFLMKDGLLARMAPGGRAGLALALLVAVLAVHFGVVAAIGGGQAPAADHDHATDHGQAAVAGAVTDESLPRDHAEGDQTHAEDGEPAVEETAAPVDEASAAAAPAAGPPPAWAIARGGSLGFGVENAGYALTGSFARWSGTIAMDPDAPESAEIAIEIDLASASMGDATQDEMLKGANFFNVASHPTARWRSTAVRALGGGRYRADGTLSLHGASRPQRIDFTLEGSGNQRFVNGSASVNRNAFGVGTGADAEGVAASVAVNFAFTATRR